MSEQLTLPLVEGGPAGDWMSDEDVDRIDFSGAAIFVHLIRSPEDPERRGEQRDKGRGWGQDKWRTNQLQGKGDGSLTVEQARKDALRLLADGEPRTFNRIAVELYDRTADVLWDSPLDQALWQLAREGRVEFSSRAPVYWRMA